MARELHQFSYLWDPPLDSVVNVREMDWWTEGDFEKLGWTRELLPKDDKIVQQLCNAHAIGTELDMAAEACEYLGVNLADLPTMVAMTLWEGVLVAVGRCFASGKHSGVPRKGGTTLNKTVKKHLSQDDQAVLEEAIRLRNQHVAHIEDENGTTVAAWAVFEEGPPRTYIGTASKFDRDRLDRDLAFKIAGVCHRVSAGYREVEASLGDIVGKRYTDASQATSDRPEEAGR